MALNLPLSSCQIVIGPPGSGKTTYCNGMQQFLRAVGRKPIIINLDPANDFLPYECDVDVSELISLEQVMAEHGFGPNGGLLFCMETLLANFDWLVEKLRGFEQDNSQAHFIFDLPGQVELFTNHDSIKKLIARLERELNYRLVAVHLSDASHCREAARFISLATLTLQSMLCLECAQINLMSKFDLFKRIQITKEDEEEIAFPLSFYADCQNLQVLAEKTPNPALTFAIAELIDDFGLLSFIPFAVEDKECVAFVMQEIDKANGFVFGALTADNESILQTAMTADNREEYLESISQKYM